MWEGTLWGRRSPWRALHTPGFLSRRMLVSQAGPRITNACTELVPLGGEGPRGVGCTPRGSAHARVHSLPPLSGICLALGAARRLAAVRAQRRVGGPCAARMAVRRSGHAFCLALGACCSWGGRTRWEGPPSHGIGGLHVMARQQISACGLGIRAKEIVALLCLQPVHAFCEWRCLALTALPFNVAAGAPWARRLAQFAALQPALCTAAPCGGRTVVVGSRRLPGSPPNVTAEQVVPVCGLEPRGLLLWCGAPCCLRAESP